MKRLTLSPPCGVFPAGSPKRQTNYLFVCFFDFIADNGNRGEGSRRKLPPTRQPSAWAVGRARPLKARFPAGSPTNGSTDMCFRFSLRYCRRMGSGGSPDRLCRSHGAQAEYSRVTTDIHGIALKVVFLIYKFSRKSQQTALINSKLLCTHKLKSGSGTQSARPFLRINFYLSSVISLRNSS